MRNKTRLFERLSGRARGKANRCRATFDSTLESEAQDQARCAPVTLPECRAGATATPVWIWPT